MRINITARHFKMSEELKQFTEGEVSRLQKYYDGIVDAEVILSWEKHDRLAEIKMSVFGTLLTALGRSQEMKKSIYEAVDKMERQVLKYKGKIRGFNHQRPVSESLNESQN